MTEWKAKRFWKEVSVASSETGYTVHLDNRPLRTPAKVPLVVPTRSFAEVIAQEWQDQQDTIDPSVMPATRTANVAIDKVAAKREEVIAHLLEYGGSDLLCYRATAPEALVLRQKERWDPLLDWSAQVLQAPLLVVQGVMPVTQPTQSIEQFRSELSGFSEFELSAFHELVSLSGSLVLALAVAKKHTSPENCWEFSRLDEQFQQEQWGEDEEALAVSAAKKVAFLVAADLLDRLQNRP